MPATAQNLLSLLLLAGSTLSAMTVTVAATSPTQAVLTYTAPDNNACGVEVSESNAYSPLVHDVDPALFSGANLDSRAGALSSGTARLFVVGTRHIQTASDSKNYSRALQQNTTHYARVTCGNTIATVIFNTKTLPFGVTMQDLFPLNADGTYNWPSVSTTNRNETLVDPSTGVLLRHVNLPGDYPVQPSGSGATAGGFGIMCNNVLTPQGNWLCTFPDIPQGIYPNLYAINPTTGVVLFLGAAYFFPGQIDPNGNSILGIAGGGSGESTMWDFASGVIAYKPYSDSVGRSSIAKYTYTGADNPANTVPASSPPQANYTVVDMLGSTSSTAGSDLNALAHAFNTNLDTSLYPCGFSELQGHYLAFTCRRGNQNSFGWWGVYDLGNGLPLGGGGDGHVVALTQMWAQSGARWCTQHTDEFLGNVPIFSIAVDTAFGSGTGMGPYLSTLNGGINDSQTSLVLTSSWTFGGSPPAGWAAGEPLSASLDHYLMNYAVNDLISIDGEVVRITAKVDSAHYTIQRAQGGTAAASHSNGANAMATCISQGDALTYSGGYLWWDFIASPNGSIPADFQIQFGSHPVSRGNYRVDSGWPFRTGAVTDHSTWGLTPASTVQSHVIFGTAKAAGDGNSFQKHVSMTAGAATTSFDQNYWVGTSLYCAQDTSCVTSITGTLYQYHYETSTNYQNSVFIARKHFPTIVKTFGRSFQDVSGPGSVLTGGAGDNYKYCVAVLANECVSGSVAGNIYFNHPSLSGTNPWCTGGENGTSAHDICIGNWWPNGIAGNQYKIVNDPTGALSYRKLTSIFGSFENGYSNIKLTYDGAWGLYFTPPNAGLPATSASVYAIKIPPDPGSDGVDRSTFVPATIHVSAPTGLGITAARVRFGYAEQGNPSSYYPTSRRESGVAVASTVSPSTPFFFASEPYTPTPCPVSCVIAIPVYPLHAAYFSLDFLNGASVVSSLPGIAMENVVIPLGGPVQAPAPTCSPKTGLTTPNVLDVQFQVNMALGTVPCTNSLTETGACNVTDVQRVVNAALGGACVIGP